MTNLTPTPVWEDVSQIETTTPVLGGAGGPANAQAQSLLNRTEFLKLKIGLSFQTAAEIAKQLSDGASIVIDCFGDSTMWGAAIGNLASKDPKNPPDTLAATLRLLYAGSFIVNNRAISSTTLSQMIGGTDGSGTTFAEKMAESNADVVYCNHCINDSQLDGDISGYRDNLVKFIDTCRMNGKVPILVTPNINPPWQIISEQKTKRLPSYVRVMRDVAAQQGCDIVDNYYYCMQTVAVVGAVELVPDGAHPATSTYAMAGRNMAIPFVSTHPLVQAGDKAGLTNASYFDNITTSRSITASTGSKRFGVNLSGVKSANNQVINFPVILDRPTDSCVLALYGAQWNSGGTSVITHNGSIASDQLKGVINQGVSLAGMDSDACFLPHFCHMNAGLHVVGLATSTGVTGGIGNGFSFSGVGLVPRVSVMPGLDSPSDIRNHTPIAPGVEICFDYFAYNGSTWKLKSTADNSTFLDIKATTTQLIVNCYGTDTVIFSSLISGTYKVRLRILQNGDIKLTIGTAPTSTIPSSAAAVPNLYPADPGTVHSVFCFQTP